MTADRPAGLVLKASYRAPYDVAAMLGFFARAVAGLEVVHLQEQWMARTLEVWHAGRIHTGWVHLQFVHGRRGAASTKPWPAYCHW